MHRKALLPVIERLEELGCSDIHFRETIVRDSIVDPDRSLTTTKTITLVYVDKTGMPYELCMVSKHQLTKTYSGTNVSFILYRMSGYPENNLKHVWEKITVKSQTYARQHPPVAIVNAGFMLLVEFFALP